MDVVKSLVTIGITSSSRILGIFAHPDDETVFTAGFLQKAVALKVNLNLIYLTSGEKSTQRNGLSATDDLGKVRQHELAHAMKIIGIQEHSFADFPDGELANQKAQLTNHLSRILLEVKPHFVITLEPQGISGHLDHITVAAVITSLYNKPIFDFSLIHATIDPTHYQPRSLYDRTQIVPVTQPNLRIKLTSDEVDRKIACFKAHQSQFRVNAAYINKWRSRNLLEYEYFRLVAE